MSYPLIDKLQKLLAKEVFHRTKAPKKAAGRALGTLVEIITYYLLKTWKLAPHVSIERGLEEYGNPDITHNVEYSLHPIARQTTVRMKNAPSITAGMILKALEKQSFALPGFEKKTNNLLKNGVLRNACTIATSPASFLLSHVVKTTRDALDIHVIEQDKKPFAMLECKRVGVEEGLGKGPQTIEKAKQGAYVAKSSSSLQKIRTDKGELHGIIYKSDGSYIIKPFVPLMEEIISSRDGELLRKFILTVGIVSNHGNWFTAEDHNKELKVLAQSYDWLLFLTDTGLSEFIEHLLLNPKKEHMPIRKAFMSSYGGKKKKNQFTKVQMSIEADGLLVEYFKNNLLKIEGWFNIITPRGKTPATLRSELNELANKDWRNILQ